MLPGCGRRTGVETNRAAEQKFAPPPCYATNEYRLCQSAPGLHGRDDKAVHQRGQKARR